MKQKYLNIICNTLHCKIDDIKSIEDCSGMTNNSYTFVVDNNKYLIRIPGIGANKLVNRMHEFEVYKTIKGAFGDDIIYFDTKTGVKISKFIYDGRNCNLKSKEDVRRCMQYLKNFHDKKLKVSFEFDLCKKILEYQHLAGTSIYSDYKTTLYNVFDCLKWIETLSRPKQLIHIDPNPDNFLISNDNIYLLDWEYAAMQDPLLDIAMFAIYSNYDENEIEQLLYYYDNNFSSQDLLIVYAYCAIAGLLWSNWCEYKLKLGQNFGEYALNQYNYAKNFSEIVLKRVYF